MRFGLKKPSEYWKSFNEAAIKGSRKFGLGAPIRQKRPRFNEAAIKGSRKFDGGDVHNSALFRASMRPRSKDRGSFVPSVPSVPSVPASMRPRSKDRGSCSADNSRCRKALASMRPRSKDRGSEEKTLKWGLGYKLQ